MNNHRILIVEDSQSASKKLALLLRDLFDMEHVSTAAEACQRLCCEPPIDVLVLDLILENGEGTDLVARMHLNFPDVPIVAVSAYEYTVEAIIGAGAMIFIRKAHLIADPERMEQYMRDSIDAAVALRLAIQETRETDEKIRTMKQAVDQRRESLLASASERPSGEAKTTYPKPDTDEDQDTAIHKRQGTMHRGKS